MMRRSHAPGDSGAAAIEMALVFCILIVPIMFGILQYGYQFWSLETGAASAREAARRLAVGTDPACTIARAKFDAGNPALGDVTVTYTPTNPRAGQIVKVTVSFQSLDTNLLPLPSDGVITEVAEARVQTARAGTATDPYLPC